jgi:hypothetical protein
MGPRRSELDAICPKRLLEDGILLDAGGQLDPPTYLLRVQRKSVSDQADLQGSVCSGWTALLQPTHI